MAFLCLDYGKKRIGVAISDPNNTVALIRPPLIDGDPFKKIQNICQENNITKIIVGLAVSFSGQPNQQTDEIKKFADLLKNRFGYEVIFEDERFSSKIAFQTKAHEKKTIRQKDYDSTSAVIILQSYLDKINRL